MTFAIINIINPASLPALSHLLQHNVCLTGKEKGNEARRLSDLNSPSPCIEVSVLKVYASLNVLRKGQPPLLKSHIRPGNARSAYSKS